MSPDLGNLTWGKIRKDKNVNKNKDDEGTEVLKELKQC